MSAREELAEKVWELACELGLNTSPCAGGMTLSADRKYRTVSIGWARYLDGEIRVYGPKFFIYRDSRNRFEKLTSFEALTQYLKTEVCGRTEAN